ncbi:MAG: hypothetical protein JWO38_6750 [Gemmataceae bacterium]|nr:hypothetical protein [Gemmataceae bacterium]
MRGLSRRGRSKELPEKVPENRCKSLENPVKLWNETAASERPAERQKPLEFQHFSRERACDDYRAVDEVLLVSVIALYFLSQ